jgi:adenosine deaminase
VQIDIFNTYADHPIDRLYRAGLSVGVNTDGRALPHVTLTQEYEKLQQTFGWNTGDFLNCNLNALRAAFLPDKMKKHLEAQLRESYVD